MAAVVRNSIQKLQYLDFVNCGVRRSDLFFVCQLDPIEETDANGNIIIPNPVPQANEIEKAEWVPLSEYRAMVKGEDGGGGHPMMSHVIDVLEGGRKIDRALSQSLVAGRKSNYVYYPSTVERWSSQGGLRAGLEKVQDC
jgi:hypothetical protein